MAKFLQGPHFIFRFHEWTYSTQQAAKLTPVSIFIVDTNTATGFQGHNCKIDGLKHSQCPCSQISSSPFTYMSLGS